MSRWRRPRLGTRIALLAVGIAVLTSLLGGVISVQLLQRASEQTARRSLAAIADEAQASATADDEGGATQRGGEARAAQALQSVNVQVAVIRSRSGQEPSVQGNALATRALTAEQVSQVVDGSSLSLRLPRPEGAVLVEARPTPAGGLVLAQRRGDALALAGEATRQLGWALLATGVVAAALGLLVAWGIARPLRRAASAATALAQGNATCSSPRAARGRSPRSRARSTSWRALSHALRHASASSCCPSPMTCARR